MAVPKRRVSNARQGNRRSHQHVKAKQVAYCNRSGKRGPAPHGLLELWLVEFPKPRSGRDADRGGQSAVALMRWAVTTPRDQSLPAHLGRATRSGVWFVLVGDQAQIEPLLSGLDSVRDRLEIFHCTQVVTMEDSPVAAFRRKPDNSITRSWRANRRKKSKRSWHGEHRCDGRGRLHSQAVPEGRSSAWDRSPDADVEWCVRPDGRRRKHCAEARTLVPVRCDGRRLRQGDFQERKAQDRLTQRRSEEAKGHDLAKDTHALFNRSHLKENFVGNVEGRDINKGVCDVIVTDGFVGNVVLKVCEGVFDFVMKVAGKEILGALNTEKLLAQQAMANLIKRYDLQKNGGAGCWAWMAFASFATAAPGTVRLKRHS